jgi:two-component system chemotaxis sensor kinase CheA
MTNEYAQDPELVQGFLVESEELLQRLDQDMVTLEEHPKDADLLNRVFRALHTIKGTSGFLGFDPIVRVSHRAEDVLNGLRRGDLEVSRRLMDALLAARDLLGAMLQDLRAGGLKEYACDPLISELEAVQKPPEVPLRLGEVLVAQEVIAPQALEKALQQQARSSEPRNLGEILLKDGMAGPAEIGHAVAQQQRVAASTQQNAQTLRVDVRKLDELVNLIGELVLERNRLTQLSREYAAGRVLGEALDSALSQSTAHLSFITEELQTAGLKTRMVPIDTVFCKFPRLVRDVALSLQKDADLVIAGKETELDKSMVELISDPLVHLVRNSIDHGIELPDQRAAAGKPRKGNIRMEASQEGDQILIVVADDGAGIDPDRIVRKAVEKGLVTAERARTLSRSEILDFIFAPGFSTAERVSNVSGRGVGMDVVRTNLKKLNGTIKLDTHPGVGTTVMLRIPLTLAILPVLLVRVADETYALPLRSVLETSRVSASQLHRVEGNEVLQLRGDTVALVRLGSMFGAQVDSGKPSADKVVILRVGEKRVAVLVDQLIGQESTVVKPLSTYLHQCSSLAGATISGDGRVRLVLDPAGLLADLTNSAPQDRSR